jgi:hypothetical protein
MPWYTAICSDIQPGCRQKGTSPVCAHQGLRVRDMGSQLAYITKGFISLETG